MASFCSTLAELWPDGVAAWLPAAPTPYEPERASAIAGYELDVAIQLAHKPERLAHSLSVGLTAERVAAAYGVEPYLARVAGILHDWSKALSSADLLERARVLGIDLGVNLELVVPLLHGIVAARELPARYPELPEAVWQAIERHTLGNDHMSPLDMVIFVADGIEPRRASTPSLEHQRSLVGTASLPELFFTSFSDGIAAIIGARRYLYPKALDIYNDVVLAYAAQRGGHVREGI